MGQILVRVFHVLIIRHYLLASSLRAVLLKTVESLRPLVSFHVIQGLQATNEGDMCRSHSSPVVRLLTNVCSRVPTYLAAAVHRRHHCIHASAIQSTRRRRISPPRVFWLVLQRDGRYTHITSLPATARVVNDVHRPAGLCSTSTTYSLS